MAACRRSAHLYCMCHGGVDVVDNRCVLQIGPNIMFFTASQPQKLRDEFCDDIPSTGQTVVALDMQDTELRDMLTVVRQSSGTMEPIHARKISLPGRRTREPASKEVEDPVTISYLPPKKYPTGTQTFETDFHRERKFIGIVTVRNEQGETYVSQFPFVVGQQFSKKIGILRHDARGTHRCGLRSLAIKPEADARCYPGIMGG